MTFCTFNYALISLFIKYMNFGHDAWISSTELFIQLKYVESNVENDILSLYVLKMLNDEFVDWLTMIIKYTLRAF